MDPSPRVCASTGHGLGSRDAGKTDPGAGVVTSSSSEADVVLAFTRLLDADFAALFAGRPGAYHMLRNAGPYFRADDEAAAHACDLFLELHTNAAKSSPKRDKREVGVEVFYEDPSDAAFARGLSADIAHAVGFPDRGGKRTTGLAVLAPHRGMTQVLVELFFGSDADDVAAFRAHRDDMELAIVNRCLGHWGWRKVKKLPRTWKLSSKAFYRLVWNR